MLHYPCHRLPSLMAETRKDVAEPKLRPRVSSSTMALPATSLCRPLSSMQRGPCIMASEDSSPLLVAKSTIKRRGQASDDRGEGRDEASTWQRRKRGMNTTRTRAKGGSRLGGTRSKGLNPGSDRPTCQGIIRHREEEHVSR